MFGVEPNMGHAPGRHRPARRQVAGTHQDSFEVSGGGAKPRREGTGRSRAGTTRAPGWVGGGRPRPEAGDCQPEDPQEMIKLALASASTAPTAT